MRRWGRRVTALAIPALALTTWSAGQEPAGEGRPEEEVVHGSRAAIGSAASETQRVWAEAGTSFLRYPDRLAPVVEVAPTRVELPVLERRGDWVAVRYRAFKVWFALGPQPESPGFELPPLYDHERRLGQARSILGSGERVRPLGPFTLYTDVREDGLLDRVAAATADLERAYRERYGIQPRLLGNEVVVLFRQDEAYRRNEGVEPTIDGLDSYGHSSATIAVLAVGAREPSEVCQLLVHELTHLLNRRGLARELPPWLEEGLAEDLSYSAIDDRGRIDPGILSGRGSFMLARLARSLNTVDSFGRNPWGSSPRAALAWLLHNWESPGRPSLEVLIDLPWTAFVEPGYRNFHYAESGFLVRYLLDRRSGLAPKMKALLGEVAAGGEPTYELFWETIGLPPSRLEQEFHNWLKSEAAAHGVPRPID